MVCSVGFFRTDRTHLPAMFCSVFLARKEGEDSNVSVPIQLRDI